jgi:hypothetical protein
MAVLYLYFVLGKSLNNCYINSKPLISYKLI